MIRCLILHAYIQVNDRYRKQLWLTLKVQPCFISAERCFFPFTCGISKSDQSVNGRSLFFDCLFIWRKNSKWDEINHRDIVCHWSSRRSAWFLSLSFALVSNVPRGKVRKHCEVAWARHRHWSRPMLDRLKTPRDANAYRNWPRNSEPWSCRSRRDCRCLDWSSLVEECNTEESDRTRRRTRDTYIRASHEYRHRTHRDTDDRRRCTHEDLERVQWSWKCSSGSYRCRSIDEIRVDKASWLIRDMFPMTTTNEEERFDSSILAELVVDTSNDSHRLVLRLDEWRLDSLHLANDLTRVGLRPRRREERRILDRNHFLLPNSE